MAADKKRREDEAHREKIEGEIKEDIDKHFSSLEDLLININLGDLFLEALKSDIVRHVRIEY